MAGYCVAALELNFWDGFKDAGSGKSCRNPMDLCTPAGMAILGLR